MSLVLVIGVLAVIWLLIGALCVALCVSAANGDRAMRATPLRILRGRRFDRDLHRAA